MQKKTQQPVPATHKVAAKGLSNKNKQGTDMMPMEFDKELKNIGSRSLWLTMVILVMCWPSFCHTILHTVFAKISSLDFKTRCRIPQLENKHWSFEQIQHIAAPLDKKNWNCTYFKYNYTVIAEMNYAEALKYIETIEHREIALCEEYIHEGCCNIYSVYKEFSLVCKRMTLEEMLNISPVYGQLIASIFLVPLADLLGRKRVIKWGANVFIAGALMMCTANNVEILIFGRILVGMAYTLTIHPMEAIVMEISNIQLRALYFITMHVGIGLGFITISLIATKIWNWRLLLWTVCSSLLVLPLTTWYVPESPRWLMSKGKKGKARGILRTVNDPVKQSDLLLFYRNEKRNYWEEIKTHVAESKPLFSKFLFLTALSFIVGGVYFKSFMTLYVSRSDYFMLSGIAEIISYVLCVPFLLVFGRRTYMGLLLLCSGITYLFAAQLETDTRNSLIFVLITELTTSTVYITSLLYINEIVPTSHRCTSTGIIFGFGAGLSTIIMFHTYSYFIADNNLFIFLSSMCFIGVPVALFADETRKKDIRDTVRDTIRPHES